MPDLRARVLRGIRAFSLSSASLTGLADRVGGGKGVEEGASAIVGRARQLDGYHVK